MRVQLLQFSLHYSIQIIVIPIGHRIPVPNVLHPAHDNLAVAQNLDPLAGCRLNIKITSKTALSSALGAT